MTNIQTQVQNLVSKVNELLNGKMEVNYNDGLGIVLDNPKFYFKNPNFGYNVSLEVSELDIHNFVGALKELGFDYEYKLNEILNTYNETIKF